ncbi:MAG: hypothetical protein M1347_02095 [Chloroflexi bacterium]|nr:hypothetical protein [Chloroflexota bacterium]
MVRIVFWISTGVLLTACSNAAVLPSPEVLAPTGNNVSEPITIVTSTPVTLISELTATTTYTVPDLGYAFDYPVAWTISALPDVPESAVTIHSWDPAMATGDRPQSEGIPEGGEKLDIIPLSMFDVDYDEALPWSVNRMRGSRSPKRT